MLRANTLKWSCVLKSPTALLRAARLLSLFLLSLALLRLRLSLAWLGRRLRMRRRCPKQNRRGRYRLRPECNFSHKT